jgi:hypothetical protein
MGQVNGIAHKNIKINIFWFLLNLTIFRTSMKLRTLNVINAYKKAIKAKKILTFSVNLDIIN